MDEGRNGSTDPPRSVRIATRGIRRPWRGPAARSTDPPRSVRIATTGPRTWTWRRKPRQHRPSEVGEDRNDSAVGPLQSREQIRSTDPPSVACHEYGTVQGGFLPGSWDHPVASDGTTRRSTPAGLIAIRLLQVVGLGGSRWRSGRLT